MATLLDTYKKVVGKFLPQGYAWDQVKQHPFVEALAVEFCRIHERGENLLREINPNQTEELILDWESLLGIPDECTPENRTLSERRAQVVQKLVLQGGLSAQFYKEIAEFYGFEIEVYNNVPFRVGYGRTDGLKGRLTNNNIARVMTVGQTVGQTLADYNWQFYFTAQIPIAELNAFRVGRNRVGEALVTAGNTLLQCTIRKLKPAHSAVFFDLE